MRRSAPSAIEHRALCSALQRRVAALDWDPPVTPEQAQALVDRMPRRNWDEALASWLYRSFGLLHGAMAGHRATPSLRDDLVAFLPPPAGRFRAIGQALAWAAAEPDQESPALPQRLEIGRGAFRVHFGVRAGSIRVTLESLGFELARLAGREVAVTGPQGIGQLLALLILDPQGEGQFEVPDTPRTRSLLLQMQIGELEPE